MWAAPGQEIIVVHQGSNKDDDEEDEDENADDEEETPEDEGDDEEEDDCSPPPPALELERVVFNLKRFQEDVGAPAAHKAFDKVDTQEFGTVSKDKTEEMLIAMMVELGLDVEDLDDDFVAENTEDFETAADDVISRGETVQMAKEFFAKLQEAV